MKYNKFVIVIHIILMIMNGFVSQGNTDEKQYGGILFPFTIEVDPMERLLLVNFEEDPDSIYVGFEPQVFDDTVNGTGHLIIGWRRDKKIDVYHQSSLQLDAARYSIVGAGLNEIIPVEMNKAAFQINDFGVQAHYCFKDKMGRAVEIKINENNKRKRKPFAILAPMGNAATFPTSLPLIFLHDFYFIRKNHTQIALSIDNRLHKVDKLPMPIDLQRMTFARYSQRPLIATFNPEHNGMLQKLMVEPNQTSLEKDNYVYEIEWKDQKPYVKAMSVKNNIHLLTVHFTPSIPCLTMIPENTKIHGAFKISGHPAAGNVAGNYYVESESEHTHVKIIPDKGWKPKSTKLSTWFLFSVAKIFKQWPTTYQWDAEIKKTADDLWEMQSKWMRTGEI